MKLITSKLLARAATLLAIVSIGMLAACSGEVNNPANPSGDKKNDKKPLVPNTATFRITNVLGDNSIQNSAGEWNRMDLLIRKPDGTLGMSTILGVIHTAVGTSVVVTAGANHEIGFSSLGSVDADADADVEPVNYLSPRTGTDPDFTYTTYTGTAGGMFDNVVNGTATPPMVTSIVARNFVFERGETYTINAYIAYGAEVGEGVAQVTIPVRNMPEGAGDVVFNWVRPSPSPEGIMVVLDAVKD